MSWFVPSALLKRMLPTSKGMIHLFQTCKARKSRYRAKVAAGLSSWWLLEGYQTWFLHQRQHDYMKHYFSSRATKHFRCAGQRGILDHTLRFLILRKVSKKTFWKILSQWCWLLHSSNFSKNKTQIAAPSELAKSYTAFALSLSPVIAALSHYYRNCTLPAQGNVPDERFHDLASSLHESVKGAIFCAQRVMRIIF